MYFKARNGSYKRVPQIPNRFLDGEVGGMTVYYTSAYDKAKVTAFKPVSRTTYSLLISVWQICLHRKRASACLPEMSTKEPMEASQSGTQSAFAVTTPKTLEEITGPLVRTIRLIPSLCPTRLALVVCGRPLGSPRKLSASHRQNLSTADKLIFRSCWDGKNLDSPDHSSHVSYPATGTFENSGPCPTTHPVKLPQLMFEVIWDTSAFNDKSEWPADGSQPFVFSSGDK